MQQLIHWCTMEVYCDRCEAHEAAISSIFGRCFVGRWRQLSRQKVWQICQRFCNVALPNPLKSCGWGPCERHCCSLCSTNTKTEASCHFHQSHVSKSESLPCKRPIAASSVHCPRFSWKALDASINSKLLGSKCGPTGRSCTGKNSKGWPKESPTAMPSIEPMARFSKSSLMPSCTSFSFSGRGISWKIVYLLRSSSRRYKLPLRLTWTISLSCSYGTIPSSM